MEGGIAASLLDYLSTALSAKPITYGEPPVRITGGFDTHIYAFSLHGAPKDWSGPLILRLFRSDNPWISMSGPDRPRFESAVQNTIFQMGYPAPRVVHTCPNSKPLGAPFLIMERLPGRIMLHVLFRPSRFWLRLPDIFAEAQARLHGLEPVILLQAVETAGVPARVLTANDWVERVGGLIDAAQLEGLKPGVEWLSNNSPQRSGSSVICHGDFHPLNILLDRDRVAGVIDWPFISIAPPEYDVGATVAIFSHGPVDLPAFLRGAVNFGRRRIVARYLRAYRRLRTLDPVALRYYEAVRLLGFLFEAGEQRQADLGKLPSRDQPGAFAAQYVVNAIILRFRDITGITLTLPPDTPVSPGVADESVRSAAK
jgi:aminoglycoside phosphotransferase (APT) family kinase protein